MMLAISADEWLTELFEFEYCEECGGEAQHHTAVGFLGNWFARCDHSPDETTGEYDPLIAAFRKGPQA